MSLTLTDAIEMRIYRNKKNIKDAKASLKMFIELGLESMAQDELIKIEKNTASIKKLSLIK